MISHDNITWLANMLVKQGLRKNETVLSYLPLSHIAGLTTDAFVIPCCGGSVFIADKNALKGTLVRFRKNFVLFVYSRSKILIDTYHVDTN